MEVVDKHLIVGLGNPSEEYAHTRHNLGFIVLRHIAEQQGLKFKEKLGKDGLAASGQIGGREAVLLLPLTYVNHSGTAVQKALEAYGISTDNLLVVCDDVSLPFGQLRLRPEGGDGGHNGLTSIISHLKTKKFARLRLGVGSPADKDKMKEFVLGAFSSTEKKMLEGFVDVAAQCCLMWLEQGMSTAMNQFNRRTENE